MAPKQDELSGFLCHQALQWLSGLTSWTTSCFLKYTSLSEMFPFWVTTQRLFIWMRECVLGKCMYSICCQFGFVWFGMPGCLVWVCLIRSSGSAFGLMCCKRLSPGICDSLSKSEQPFCCRITHQHTHFLPTTRWECFWCVDLMCLCLPLCACVYL